MRDNLIVFLLSLVLSSFLFWPVFIGEVNINSNLLVSFYAFYGQNLPFKNTGLDQLRLYFPTYNFTLGELRHLRLPLWNPYSFSGQANVGELQSAVFYPLNLAGLVLPLEMFWNFMRVSPQVLAVFFSFLYFRGLKLGKIASFFGATTFGLSPFLLTWGEEQIITTHAVLWLPLALLSVDKISFGKRAVFWKIVLAFSICFSLLAGFVQISLYLVLLVLAYALFKYGLAKLALIPILILGFLIASVQLMPALELYLNAPRSSVLLSGATREFLLPAKSLFSYLSPDIFGNPATYNFFRGGRALYYEGMLFVGVAPLMFALVAIQKLKRRENMFWFVSWVVTLVMVVDTFVAKFIMAVPIPVFSSSIPNRVLFINAFAMSALAAYGMEAWLQNKQIKIKKTILGLLALYALLLFYTLLVLKINVYNLLAQDQISSLGNALVTFRNLLVPFGVFVAVGSLILFGSRFGGSRGKLAILIVLISFLHTFYFANKYLSFSNKVNLFAETPVLSFIKNDQGYFRSWAIGDVYLENNFHLAYRLFWPEGYKSLFIDSYGDVTRYMNGWAIEDNLTRADAGLGSQGTADEIFSLNSRRRMLDLLGVRYVVGELSDEEGFKRYNFSRVFEDGRLAVYENKTVLPRAFLASNYEGAPSVDSTNKNKNQIDSERRVLIPRKLASEGFDFRNVLILEEPSPISPQFGQGEVEIAYYQPNKVIVKTRSDVPKLLFLSDNYYPGWKARVDGEETKIFRANYSFRAVPLVAGEHEVEFYFDSRVFKAGALFSLLGVVALIFVSRGRSRRRD